MNPMAQAIAAKMRKRDATAPEAPFEASFPSAQTPMGGDSVHVDQQAPEARQFVPEFNQNEMTPLTPRRRTQIPGVGYIR